MTHDPLCPFSRECVGSEHEPFAVGPLTCSNTECLAICDCDCDRIAEVRADERIKAVQECMETVNVIVWKYHNTHYRERAEVARECQRSLRAVQAMP